jgi:hypothetical protein
LRNDFGGHYQFRVAKHATANFHANSIGKIEWNSGSTNPWWLRLDFATDIIAAGLEGTLGPSIDILLRLRETIEIIGGAYNHAHNIVTHVRTLSAGRLWLRVHELLSPIDIVGPAREGRVDHNMYGQSGDIRRLDNPADG